MTIKKAMPVLAIICVIIIVFAVVMSITYMLAHKPKSAGISVTICPPEKQVEIARFINNCSGAHSEAYCYALAKAEYCSVVRRF